MPLNTAVPATRAVIPRWKEPTLSGPREPFKLTLVSVEGVYITVARPKAICYGRTFTVNGRAFTFVTWKTV